MKKFFIVLLVLSYLISCKNESPKIITNTIGIKFVLVEAGSFNMGDEFGDGFEEEQPLHKVTLPSFYIGKYEVLQKEWNQIDSYNPSLHKGDNFPVERVSWEMVNSFISKLNNSDEKYRYRLPTEAEWEYAAKGGKKGNKTLYAGSNDPLRVARYSENSTMISNKAGSLSSNELRIFDMSGNVSEWCSDWHDEFYYKKSPEQNPQGPKKGKNKVVRGGAWYSIDSDLRVSDRDYESTEQMNDVLGFRLVLEIKK